MARSALSIGVFSDPHNRQAAAVQRHLDDLAPGTCRYFALPVQGVPRVAIDETGVYWDESNVAQLDTAYIHGFAFASPIVPTPLGDRDWSVWQTDHIAQQQSFSFLYSAFEEMRRRGVELLNPARAHVQNFMKADLLEDLRQAGFLVPRLLCTNDMETTQAFVREIERVVWRPATGRAAWQLFLDRQREHLISPSKPPILLAETIDGVLIRAYVLEGKALLYLRRTAPADTPPLETLEAFQAIECPAVDGELQRLTETMALPWAQVLFVLREDRAWIYDVDADPIYDWLPDIFQQRLTQALARGLLGMPVGAAALPDGPYPRDALFLRRMLRDVFDLEYRKYQPP